MVAGGILGVFAFRHLAGGGDRLLRQEVGDRGLALDQGGMPATPAQGIRLLAVGCKPGHDDAVWGLCGQRAAVWIISK